MRYLLILLATWIVSAAFGCTAPGGDHCAVQTCDPQSECPPCRSQSAQCSPPDQPVRAVRFEQPADESHEASEVASAAPEEIRATRGDDPGVLPIDLPTALHLANAENLQVAVAREQVRQAWARVDAADALWLPSVRGGLNYNRHEGAIQDVVGNQFNTSRGAFYTGAGAGGFGAGSPSVPGVYANFHLADALFQPLAARQLAAARNRAAVSATNDTLLQVTLAYFEVLRADQDLSIASDARDQTGQLADMTAAYAESGEGLRADAHRMSAELAIRTNDVERSKESRSVASARLAQLLHLDPALKLNPADPAVVPIEMFEEMPPLRELIAQGLSERPELAEQRLLLAEAVQRLRREQYAPLIPSVIVGTSYGGMSAGRNDRPADLRDRFDFDALAYWELRNLGLGDRAARSSAQSVVSQTRLKQLGAVDLVTREIVEAHAQVELRRQAIATAKQGIAAAIAAHQESVDRIQAAKGLPIEALQSVQALAQSRREYLRAVIEYNSAQCTLYRAIGWPADARP